MIHAKFQNHGTSGQGHNRVIIYTKFVNLESLMVHVSSRSLKVPKRKSVKVLAIYGRDGHLGHIMFTKFMFPLPKEAPHKI